MARHDEAQPVDHGFGSATVITAAETGKGLLRGTGEGMWRGALYGALTTGLVLGGLAFLGAGGWAMLFASSTLAHGAAALAMTVGGVGAVIGGLAGAFVGTPTGAITGAFQGAGEGNRIVTHDRAAAQVARSLEATAEAQHEAAKALQARIIERMSQPVAVVTPEASPMIFAQPIVSEKQYQGCIVSRDRGPQQTGGIQTRFAGGYAQNIEQQAAVAGMEQQIR